MTAPPVTAFDVCGPLPTGTTLLEASAGTGKTFTIAALATRYIAEGCADLPALMLVTFSRSATRELRERVRERLVSAERALADPAAARGGPDGLLRHLADVPDGEARERRRRLGEALAAFDEATIATTHGFCQQMLAGLGLTGDLDRAATFVENVDDLVTEVVDDLYLRKFAPAEEPPELTYAEALTVGRQAMADPHALLVPEDAPAGSPAQQRYGLARAVRCEVARRKRLRRLLDYDDLLTRLRDVLTDPRQGEAARQRLRSRYRVVLVDEFQDTDPVQWEILCTAFHGSTTLVLIGDPKQAIYAFRGADVVAYLGAARVAGARCTLGRNWRSDAALVTALQAVFRGAALGDPEIVVRPVDAAHAERRLRGAGAPLRLRFAAREASGGTDRSAPAVGAVRLTVARDLAGDIVALLSGAARLRLDGDDRPVRPGDVAVLVQRHEQASLVRAALAEAGVPVVVTGTRSVFSTRVARDWLTLLRAVEQPHRAGLGRAAALTPFLGWAPRRLAEDGEAASEALAGRLRQWHDVLAQRGVAALLEAVVGSEHLMARLLATPDGERDLTDLRHVAESLHAAATGARLGPAALALWLQQRIAEAQGDVLEERSRRLDSDAAAVQVVTIHASKGLQFPVVYVPFGWDRHLRDVPGPLRLHDPDGARLLDVGGSGAAGYVGRLERFRAEDAGEDLRLLYVAMTRAQCQVVTWWAGSRKNTTAASLHRLLFDDALLGGGQPAQTVAVPSDRAAMQRLLAWAAGCGGTVAVEPAGSPAGRWRPPAVPDTALSAGAFDRTLDGAWRRTSYTGLTAVLHDPAGSGPVDSEPEVTERGDEPDLPPLPEPAEADAQEQRLRAVASPMAGLPAGAAFGTVVHAALELLDPGATDLEAELAARCADAVGRRLGTPVDPSALAAGLLAALRTPLGPLADERRLCDVPAADRLAELDFELPLAGGDRPRAADATLSALAGLLRRHLPATDPLAGYPDALEVPELAGQRLRGYLAGSIDAVLRIGAAAAPRYLVVDYKTNWLGGSGPGGPDPLSAWHYRPAALTTEMLRAHYPLQALLYCVALHRFLRWRQPGYHPDRHLGGVLYLFLRGMSGPDTPRVDGQPCGVFSWRPPAGLVEAVSALLDGGTG